MNLPRVAALLSKHGIDREEASWSCMQGMIMFDSEFWAERGGYWGLEGMKGNCKDWRSGRASDALEEAPGEVGRWRPGSGMHWRWGDAAKDLDFDHQNVSSCLWKNERSDRQRGVQERERHILNLPLVLAGMRTYCWVWNIHLGWTSMWFW